MTAYADSMFPTMTSEGGEEFVLKPVNCPFHIQIYANEHRGALPPSLDVLLTSVDLTSEVFVCPSSDHERAAATVPVTLVPGALTIEIAATIHSTTSPSLTRTYSSSGPMRTSGPTRSSARSVRPRLTGTVRLREADTGRRDRRTDPVQDHDAQREQDLAATRAALGEDALTTAWEEGRKMTLDEAVTFALGPGKELK